jgi:hypothetical protein
MNTVVDVSMNKGAPLNCCTYIACGKKLELSGTVDGSIKQGGGGAVRWEGEV